MAKNFSITDPMNYAGPIFYRLNDDNSGPELLMEVFVERGWRAWESSESSIVPSYDEGYFSSWTIWWRHNFSSVVYKRLKPFQVVNHIQKASGLCKKDSLARILQKMKNSYGPIYEFVPQTFLLPSEYTKLVADYTRLQYESKGTVHKPIKVPAVDLISSKSSKQSPQNTVCYDPANTWICKPTGSSQGKGITIFRDLHQLTYTSSAVVQNYIHNPLLVGGYKCDIRIYVLVPNFLPLTVYTYSQGIVRFATEKYDLANLDNQFSHLTNTSLNKNAPGYKIEKERVGSGCKWTTRQLRRHLASYGERDWLLWQRIHILITLSLLSQLSRSHGSHMQAGTSFELFGFDILIDDCLNPWLLEVNRCPSLTYDCEVDRVVKKPLLHDLFDLIGLPKMPELSSGSLRSSGILNGLYQRQRGNSESSTADSSEGSDEFISNRSNICETCEDKSVFFNERKYLKQLPKKHSLKRRYNSNLWSCDSCRDDKKSETKSSAFSKSEISISKISIINSPLKLNSTRRRRSLPSFSEGFENQLLPEEIRRDYFVPITFNTTFQKLRNQFIRNNTKGAKFLADPTSRNVCYAKSTGRKRAFFYSKDRRGSMRQKFRCGDWIRTFPFNAATLHMSKDSIYMKSLVAEIQKYKKTCEKLFRDYPNVSDDYLDSRLQRIIWKDHVIWAPPK